MQCVRVTLSLHHSWLQSLTAVWGLLTWLIERAEDCQALQHACCCNASLRATPTCRNPAHKGVTLDHGHTHCKRFVWAGPGGWHMLQQHVQQGLHACAGRGPVQWGQRGAGPTLRGAPQHACNNSLGLSTLSSGSGACLCLCGLPSLGCRQTWTAY